VLPEELVEVVGRGDVDEEDTELLGGAETEEEELLGGTLELGCPTGRELAPSICC
jgi:hypothetical protein